MKEERTWIGRAFFVTIGLVLAIYTLFPYLAALVTALTPLEDLYLANQAWRIPTPPSLRNFVEMWDVAPVGRHLLNSFFVCTVAVVLVMFAGLPAAFALAHLHFPGRRAYLYLILSTQMLAPVVLVIPLYRLVAAFGLVDNLWGLAVIDAAFMLAPITWLLYGYFHSLPQELLDAAALDGCNRWQTLLRVALPLVRPGSVAALVFAFAFAWNEFLFALTFLRNTEQKVVAVGIFEFTATWTTYWPYMMAATLLATAPVVILFMLLEKRIVSGLMEGAVK